jgi:hypothetical protein
MEEEKKPFDTVSIVILVLLSIANDAAEIFFDILAATVVGLPGEAIMEPIDFIMDGIVTFWFFGVCGFGGPSIIQLVDDLLELVGVPGRTICVVSGILIANNQKLEKVAEVAGSLETGGAGRIEATAGEATEVGAVVATEARETAEAEVAAGETASATESSATSVEPEAGPARREAEVVHPEEERGIGEEGEGEKKGAEEEIEKEMEPEEERPPEEVEQEKLFEKTPQTSEQENEENTEESTPSQNVSLVSETIRKHQRAQEVKENLEHPKAPHDVTNDDENEDLRIAA